MACCPSFHGLFSSLSAAVHRHFLPSQWLGRKGQSAVMSGECAAGKSHHLSALSKSLIYCITPKPPLSTHWMARRVPWRIKHAHWPANLPVRSPNCYNNIYPHGLCDLPLLFNSVPRYNLEFLARVHFESQHQKSGIYCLLVSVILHHSLHFVGI